MKQSFLAVAILLSAALLGFLNYKLKPAPRDEMVNDYARHYAGSVYWQNQIAPDFQLVTTTGQQFQLSQVVGQQVIVLNFFATWCEPCREEMPELNRYFNQHKSDSFLLLAIDAEEKPEAVSAYIKDMKLDFPVAIDNGPVGHQYMVSAYPTTVVIGLDGKIELYETGGIENADVVFDPLIDVNKELRRSGKVISPDDYRLKAQQHPELAPSVRLQANTSPNTSSNSDVKLQFDDRGKRILAKMDCPCGCDKKVKSCGCHTSRNVQKALATENFHDSPDLDVIHALNKRFCGGDM